MIWVVAVGAVLALGSPVLASSSNTLCHPNETVVFSCATGSARLVSVCASKPVSKTAGYIQYRFGQKDKLELVYPETPQAPAGLFTPGTLAFSGGGGAYLSFRKGGYRYTVFSAIGNWGKTGKGTAEGVAIRNGEKEVASLPCRKSSDFDAGELGPDFFEKAGLGEPETDFEIPDVFFPK